MTRPDTPAELEALATVRQDLVTIHSIIRKARDAPATATPVEVSEMVLVVLGKVDAAIAADALRSRLPSEEEVARVRRDAPNAALSIADARYPDDETAYPHLRGKRVYAADGASIADEIRALFTPGREGAVTSSEGITLSAKPNNALGAVTAPEEIAPPAVREAGGEGENDTKRPKTTIRTAGVVPCDDGGEGAGPLVMCEEEAWLRMAVQTGTDVPIARRHAEAAERIYRLQVDLVRERGARAVEVAGLLDAARAAGSEREATANTYITTTERLTDRAMVAEARVRELEAQVLHLRDQAARMFRAAALVTEAGDG